MKIVLATPLYPPDIAEPAPYVKELARRLSQTDDVTIVTYGRFVEPIEGVRIVTSDKRSPAPVRLAKYFLLLLKAVRGADMLYAENGPSVELPLLFVSFLTNTPIILHIGDQRAEERAAGRALPGFLNALVRTRTRSVFNESPLPRPEIIPFLPRPVNEERAYEGSWMLHLARMRAKCHG